MDSGPQYYHITCHYETLRIFAGLQILLLKSEGSDCPLVNHAICRISDGTCRTSTQGGLEARLLDGSRCQLFDGKSRARQDSVARCSRRSVPLKRPGRPRLALLLLARLNPH